MEVSPNRRFSRIIPKKQAMPPEQRENTLSETERLQLARSEVS